MSKRDKDMSVTIERVIHRDVAGGAYAPLSVPLPPSKPQGAPRLAVIGLVGLRLAIGFEFLWAFFDKTFGLGFATPVARAGLNGGSRREGFLSGRHGPLRG